MQGQHISEHVSYTAVATGRLQPLARSPHQKTLGAHEARLLRLSPMSVAEPHKHLRVGLARARSGAPETLDNTCAQLGPSGQCRHHEPHPAP